LVTTQPWYPGWSATIDGLPARLEPVDGALVGVELPPGTHAVTISYRPAGLELGILITLCAITLLAVLAKSDMNGERLARLFEAYCRFPLFRSRSQA
jgi:uncharacterized membrane protein YfhO